MTFEPGSLLGVGAACALVLALAEGAHRLFGIAPEWTRKLTHVLMGLIACAFPWILPHGPSVFLLCAVFAVILGVSRRSSALPSVHGVDRRTAGALWFPLAVAIVSWAARGRPDRHVAALLVLTLADPAAAIVGRAYGAHRYDPGRDARSVEGSLAFFVVAFPCLLAGLAFGGSPGAARPVAWALGIALALAAIEAIAPGGSDNLLIPVGALALLRAAEITGAARTATAWLALAGVVALCTASRAPRERARG